MPTMLLPIELTETEKVNVLNDLSLKLTALEAAKAAKKAATAEHNEEIKNLEGSIHGLNESIKAGTVDRDVEVEREANGFAGKVKIWRLDRTPKEFVKEVDMDPDEAQLRFKDASVPGPGGKVTNLADHQTEEQALANTPEEAEELRAQRLQDEREERVAALAAELTDTVHVEEVLPEGIDGVAPTFRGKLTYDTIDYEQTRDTAEEAKAAAARHAADHITAMQEEAAAVLAASAPITPDPIENIMAALAVRVVIEERGADFLARIDGAIEGLPGRNGFSGPIRPTVQETTDEMLANVRQLLQDSRPWAEAVAASAETQRQNEIDKLAADQAADATATSKKLLKVPRGAKSRKTVKVVDEKGATLAEGSSDPAPDVTPPPGLEF